MSADSIENPLRNKHGLDGQWPIYQESVNCVVSLWVQLRLCPPSPVPPTAVLRAASPPPQLSSTQPPPPGQAQPCLSEYARMKNPVKLKSVTCKKKAGKYEYFNHIDITRYLYQYGYN